MKVEYERHCPECNGEHCTLILNTKDFYPGVGGPRSHDFVCDDCKHEWKESLPVRAVIPPFESL